MKLSELKKQKFWLMKSEPESWSWQDQIARGEKGEPWNGVRNYQASNFMKEMKIGDKAFFYHSVKEKSIVGIVEVIGTYRPDPTDEKGKFGLVEVKAVIGLPQPVSLAQIKAMSGVDNFLLVRQSRLSVLPVPDSIRNQILELSGIK